MALKLFCVSTLAAEQLREVKCQSCIHDTDGSQPTINSFLSLFCWISEHRVHFKRGNNSSKHNNKKSSNNFWSLPRPHSLETDSFKLLIAYLLAMWGFVKTLLLETLKRLGSNWVFNVQMVFVTQDACEMC